MGYFSNLAITRRTSTSGREDRSYPSRRETLEYYLEDLTSALESLSGTRPHDPMDPAFDGIFYSNGRYRYNEVLWADHVTVQDKLAVEVAKQSLQNSMPQVTSTIAEQLSQSGETSADAAGLVDALSHAYMLTAANLQDVFTYEAAAELYGPTLTEAEQNLIADSDAGNQTLSRMLRVPINIKLTTEVSQEAAVSAENDVTVNVGDIKSTVLANAVQQAQANGVVTKAMVNSVLKSSDALEELGVVRAGQSDVKIRKKTAIADQGSCGLFCCP